MTNSLRRSLPLAVFAVALSLTALASPVRSDEADFAKSFPKTSPKDFPWWRGANRDGISVEAKTAEKWSTNENVVWKAKIPGKGHSSPVVWGDRVFITAADDATSTQRILAYDRKTGKELWRETAHQGEFPRKYPKNTHASATQACDGERVYSVFLTGTGLYATATTLDGKRLWQKQAGPFTSEHGYGSSPVLYKNFVIINGDNMTGCFIAALDCKTGETVWKTDRKTTGKHGSYATPTVAYLAGKPQLILAGMHETTSFNPDTGEAIWWCRGPAEVSANTPAVHDKWVFSSGGYPEKEILAIRADGTGDVSKSHVEWRVNKGATYVPSPLYHAGRLYVVNDGGVATCIDAKNGNKLWQERLPGAFSSSPVLVGDRIFISNEAGVTYVLKAGDRFEQLGSNELGEGILSTPTICGGRTFIRTTAHLYCIGN